jgi:hypothetical protein
MSDANTWTKTEKKQGNITNKGACRELRTGNKVSTRGTGSKVDPKNLEAKIPNEDLSSRSNPRVEFEKNFRRVAFGLQKTARLTMLKSVATTESQESMKSTVDNPELHSHRDTGSKRRHSDQFNTRILWQRAFFKNVTGETTDAEESKEV